MGFSHEVTFRIYLPNIKSKTNDHILKGEIKRDTIFKRSQCLVFYLEFTSPDYTTWGRTKDFALLNLNETSKCPKILWS